MMYKFFTNLKALRIFSFISSMFPLSIFLTLDHWKDNYKVFQNKFITLTPFIVSLGILAVVIISVIYLIIFFHYKTKENNFENCTIVKIVNPKQEKINASNYLLANVLPIVTLDYNKTSVVIFSSLLIISLGIMYYKNNLYYLNPIYDLINMKVYTCTVIEVDDNDRELSSREKIVLSKINLYNFKHVRFKVIENSDAAFVVKRAE